MLVFPNAKINLGLYVTHKRSDGFHDLETIFYPIPLTDVLEIIEDNQAIECTVSGLTIANTTDENLCLKAFRLIKNDFPYLPNVHIYLHKVIPIGAGLGGGSADAAFVLRLLNNQFQLNISEKQLMDYALQLGSDCPFFIYNRPCIATSRGEILDPVQLDLSNYYFVLINPKIHISTAWAFGKLHPQEISFSLKNIIAKPVQEWKNLLQNNFEPPVFERFPEIKMIKEKLYQYGAVYASMTGSGSSVYGLFSKDIEKEDLEFDKNYFVFKSKL